LLLSWQIRRKAFPRRAWEPDDFLFYASRFTQLREMLITLLFELAFLGAGASPLCSEAAWWSNGFWLFS